MGVLLLVLGVMMFLAGGATALSRLLAGEHEEKKSPRNPLIILAVGLLVAIIGFFRHIGA